MGTSTSESDLIQVERQKRNRAYGMAYAQLVLAGGLAICGSMFVAWLFLPAHLQLLVAAVGTGIEALLVFWSMRLIQRDDTLLLGIRLLVYSFIVLLTGIIIPVPFLLAATSLPLFVVTVLSYLAFSQRERRFLLTLIVLAYPLNQLIAHSHLLDHLFVALDPNVELFLIVISAFVAALASGIFVWRILEKQESSLLYLFQARLQIALERPAAEQQERQRQMKTVEKYDAYIAEVARGNLKVELSLDDSQPDAPLTRLGYSLKDMAANIGRVNIQLGEVSSRVAAAAAEILAATTQQMASTTEQEAAVTQTMATTDEVMATVTQPAQRAQAVSDTARQSVEISRQGEQTVEASITGMQTIRERVNAIAETILSLSERTQQIGEIIETVNDIADQSKLLALNASIEAARAGEEGRGFAVVALEVRQLAEQSRQATARVRAILQEIQQATNTAVMVTEEGSKGAEAGMALVNQAGQAIADLTHTIEEAAQAAVQIVASAQQQTNGIEQLAGAIFSIRQASAQTAASTRQAEQSAKDLTAIARQLDATIQNYGA